MRLGPLFRTRRRGVSFIPDEPLPASDDKKVRHVTKDPVEVSALACFENDGSGLDAVRRSKSRAMELLLFLANYVLEEEPDTLEPVTGECECGRQHRYYPCHWLIPMWDRKWVPLGDNKQAAATAESIAQLFQGEEERLGENLLKKKQEGKPIERPQRRGPTNVVNLMEALRRSVEASSVSASNKAKTSAPTRRSSPEKSEQPKRKKTRAS